MSDISRLKRTYTPAVHLDGCGQRVAHNLFERMPSSAMRIEGNDHLIELNLIRKVVEESDDQGGIDMFGNPLYRGVVIRWNRWSDIRGGTHNGAAGVRLDDMISGIVVHGNLFERRGAVALGARSDRPSPIGSAAGGRGIRPSLSARNLPVVALCRNHRDVRRVGQVGHGRSPRIADIADFGRHRGGAMASRLARFVHGADDPAGHPPGRQSDSKRQQPVPHSRDHQRPTTTEPSVPNPRHSRR